MVTNTPSPGHPFVEVRAQFHTGTEPFYATGLASGADLIARLEAPRVVAPGERTLIPTGLFLEIPPGYEAQVRSRSGLALRQGLVCLNSPGTIDADYRGEVQVIVANLGNEKVEITHGMRIAQLVFAPVVQAQFVVGNLSSTKRGAGGFGSTGLERKGT